jgi:hypothetical protein
MFLTTGFLGVFRVFWGFLDFFGKNTKKPPLFGPSKKSVKIYIFEKKDPPETPKNEGF